MIKNDYIKVFEPAGECISEALMLEYIDKRLRPSEMHRVEKHLLACELCSDAMEGLMLLKNRGKLSIIKQKAKEKLILHEMPIDKKKSGKVIGLNSKRFLAIAASLLLLIGAVFFFNYYITNERMNAYKIAENTSTPKVEMPKLMEQITGLKSDSEKTITGNQIRLDDAEKLMDNNKVMGGAGETSKEAMNGITQDVTEKATTEKKAEIKNLETVAIQAKEEGTFTLAETKISSNKSKAKDNDVKKSEPSKNNVQAPATASDAFAEKTKSLTDSVSKLDQTNNYISSTGSSLPAKELTKAPEFKNGNESLKQYIKRNFVYPETLENKTIKGTILVTLVVTEKGKLKKFKVTQGLGKELNAEALRLVKDMPNWEPALENGKPVSQEITIPIIVE
jgi:TonB family protein